MGRRSYRGVPSAETFPTKHNLAYPGQVIPVGLSSASAFGTPTAFKHLEYINPNAIASAQALGGPTITPGAKTTSPSGIATGQAFGPSTSVKIWTPADYDLTAWWEANYPDGSYPNRIWLGRTSIGTSSAQDLTAASSGETPATGSAVNGYTPADFDGPPPGDDYLILEGTLSTYAAAGVLSGWALINADTNVSNGQILIIPSAGILTFLDNTNNKVLFTGPNSVGVRRAITTGAWKLVTFRFNTGAASGQQVQVGVNEVPGAAGGESTASANGSWDSTALASTVQMGGLSFSSDRFDGKIASFGLSKTALPDDFFTSLRHYLSAKFNQSL